jgi:hypothetical protein
MLRGSAFQREISFPMASSMGSFCTPDTLIPFAKFAAAG